MSWIKCSEKLPDKPGLIEVLIGSMRFLGYVRDADKNKIYIDPPNFVAYELDNPRIKQTYLDEIPIVSSGDYGKGWIKADHLKEPTHWIYIDDLPT